jgi:hypothetical protein
MLRTKRLWLWEKELNKCSKVLKKRKVMDVWANGDITIIQMFFKEKDAYILYTIYFFLISENY